MGLFCGDIVLKAPKPTYLGPSFVGAGASPAQDERSSSEVIAMPKLQARFLGVELYFENLETAKTFYRDTLQLKISDEQPGHHAKFDNGAGFVCLERKGFENYPSKDKAVLFFEVPDLKVAVAAIGKDRLVKLEKSWAALHDPEGHNIVLIEGKRG